MPVPIRTVSAGALLVGAAAVAVPSAASSAPAGPDDDVLPAPMPAAQALTTLGEAAEATVAATNDVSEARLERLARDRTFWLDEGGLGFYVEPVARSGQQAPTASPTSAEPYPLADTFALHSLPGSDRTIYLDFDGETVTGTAWNQSTGTDPDVYGAYDSDGDPGLSSDAELTEIQLTFQRVAEDYATSTSTSRRRHRRPTGSRART